MARRSLLVVGCTIAIVMAFVAAGCAGSDDSATANELRSALPTEPLVYSMAAEQIDAISDDEIVAVVVPSDSTLLELDADRLATLAGDGELGSLVVPLQASSDIDLTSVEAIEGAEVFVFDWDDTAHLLRAKPPTPTFAGRPIVSIERRNELTIIVIDGIIEP